MGLERKKKGEKRRSDTCTFRQCDNVKKKRGKRVAETVVHRACMRA